MNKKILIADDEEHLLTLLKDNLEFENFTVIVAHTGLEAVDLACRHLPDLILLDIGLPVYDGIEVCRRLKAETTTASIPVIFLSALARGENMREGIDAGAARYLTKPCNPRQLIKIIKEELTKADQPLNK